MQDLVQTESTKSGVWGYLQASFFEPRTSNFPNVFPYWMCENYLKYSGHEENLPFDQHFLLAAIAPRRLYIGTGERDYWAGPKSQYRACFAASFVYEALGAVPAFTSLDRYPVAGDCYHDGYIGFHMRSGAHFLSRRDWRAFIEYYKRWMTGYDK